jgi:EpsI family protein
MSTDHSSPPAASSIPWVRHLPVLALTAIGLALVYFDTGVTAAPHSGVVMSLPLSVGDYLGYPAEVTKAEKDILPPDTEFARRNYESTQGDVILCSIVLAGAERRSIHKPQDCLPGQGWRIDDQTIVKVPLSNGRELSAMNLLLSRRAEDRSGKPQTIRSYYLYWFVGDKITTPSHAERIFHSSWDKIFHGINHRWAYVIVTSTITEGLKPDGKNPEQTLTMLKEFMREIVPTFQKSEMAPTTP